MNPSDPTSERVRLELAVLRAAFEAEEQGDAAAGNATPPPSGPSPEPPAPTPDPPLPPPAP